MMISAQLSVYPLRQHHLSPAIQVVHERTHSAPKPYLGDGDRDISCGSHGHHSIVVISHRERFIFRPSLIWGPFGRRRGAARQIITAMADGSSRPWTRSTP